MSRRPLHPGLLILPALLLAGPAQAQGTAEPRLPTVEELLRNQAQPQAQPQARGQATPAAPSLPTLGDLAKTQAAPAQPNKVTCEPPKPPGAPPNGRTATEVEMREAEVRFRAFVKSGQDFQSCIDKAQREAYGGLSVADYLRLESVYQQMQRNLQREADRFNEQLRLFRAR